MPTPTTAKLPKPRSEDEFEDICVDFLRLRWKDPHATRNGRRGQRQSDAEIRAIQAGVRFSALDANDQVLSGLNVGHFLVTTENAELFLQPVDERDGSIAHRTGGALKSLLTGGYKIGDSAVPLPDATVPILRPVTVSKKLAAAVFRALTTASAQNDHIRIALEWHTVAMSNPNAVPLQQRLIAIKTAFEALLGTSDSRDCARRLRALFETAAGPHLHLLPWAGLLWSPKERKDLVRYYATRRGGLRSDTRSELEDWFMTLAAARNSVIHDGVLSATDYGAPQERPLSRYKGSLFWTGERLVREAIKASLGAEVLLCARLKEEASWAEFIRLLHEEHPDLAHPPTAARDDQEKEPEPATVPAPAVPPRATEEIILALDCRTANEITINSVVGGAAATEELARDNTHSARGKWTASVGVRSMLITTEEHALLEAAGAEEELPDHFRICD